MNTAEGCLKQPGSPSRCETLAGPGRVPPKRCTSDLVVNPTVPSANLGDVPARVTAVHSDHDDDNDNDNDDDDDDEP